MEKETGISRVLVIRAGQLGDTVCASSIIEPLRHHFGTNVIIDWVAKAGIGQLFAKDPRINRVFELRNRRPPIFFNPPKMRIVFHSWLRRYDYIINLELGTIFNDVMRLSRARTKIGMPFKYFAEPPEFHAVENLKLIYRSFLEPGDLDLAAPNLRGTPPAIVRDKFALDGEYFVLVPANSHLGKTGKPNYRAWPETHWLTLMQDMSDRGLQGVVIGAKGDAAFLNSFKRLPKGIVSLIGKTSFPELVGLIGGAQGVISTDTGPSHIAAAVNTPVYALIGPTNYKRTGPYPTKENKIHILSAHLPCSPCYHTERLRNCKKNECMYAISPSEALNTILSDIRSTE